MEVLHSGNSSARAAAIDALDRSLTGAIASPSLGQIQHRASNSEPAAPVGQHTSSVSSTLAADSNGSSTVNAAGDVEHMLLVALESMYKEEREPDVRLGLLRIALHVLQRHGECLSRWVGAVTSTWSTPWPVVCLHTAAFTPGS